MINSIIQGISIALNTEFGDSYTIYADSVEQGLREPCFFVYCVNSKGKRFLGRRYFFENQFCIQYFPDDEGQAYGECNRVAQKLHSCLEYTTLDGDLTRGTGMRYEIAGGVLHFFVNYNLFVYKGAALEAMEEISENITMKKEGDTDE